MRYLLLAILFSSCASKPPCKGLTHSCENGDGEACYKLGSAVYGTIAKGAEDPKRALSVSRKWLKQGCMLGHSKSCQAEKEIKEK